MFQYNKKELKTIFLVTLVLTFVFAFNDGRPTFIFASWLTNFIKVFIIVALGIIVHDFGHDFMAKRFGFNSEFQFWKINRFGFRGKPSFPKTFRLFGKKLFHLESFPLGILFAFILTVLSNGQLYWAAVSSYRLVTLKSHRLGRAYVEVIDFEEAKIAIAGSLALVFFIIILKLFNGNGALDQVLFIYSVMVVYDMLPLPGLDGFKVMMGSKPLYAFGLAFIVSSVLFVHHLGAIFSLILAILISLVVGVTFLYFRVFK